jgi:polyhydroxybutyrate depolymerase
MAMARETALIATLVLPACSGTSTHATSADTTSADATPDVASEGDDVAMSAPDADAPEAVTCPTGAKSGSASGAMLTITVDENPVSVLVRPPPGYSATTAYPFVMVFAPSGAATPDQNEGFTGLTPLANARGYIIAYANNSLFSETGLFTQIQQSAAAIPAVTAKWCVDPKRIYATGHSNGGTITEVIAAKGWATLAAIAPSAAGFNGSNFMSVGCPSSRIPEMEIHSTGDQLFPVSQGFGANVATMWASCDGCNATPSAADSDGCIDYSGCKANVEVRYCQGTDPHPVWPTHLNGAIFDFFDRFSSP